MSVSNERSADAERYRRLYNSRGWRKRRAAHLQIEPLCRMCKARGILNDGSRTMTGDPQHNPKRRYLVADHITPHRGELYKFWWGELQTLCPDHHEIVKQSEEARGFAKDVGLDGWPIDPRHPANDSQGGGSKV